MDIALLAKIIFDFDGVMIDLADLYFTEIEAVAKAFGVKQPAMEEIARHWGKGLREFLKNIIPEVTMEEFLQKSAELGFQKDKPPRILGVRRILSLLAVHYSLSIVTNRERESLMTMLAGAGINIGLFRFIRSASDLPPEFHKPNPLVFSESLHTLGQEGVKRDQVAYIGDNEGDFEAATGAGINFIAVTSGRITTREDFVRLGVPKEHILESIRDLPGFLGLLEE